MDPWTSSKGLPLPKKKKKVTVSNNSWTDSGPITKDVLVDADAYNAKNNTRIVTEPPSWVYRPLKTTKTTQAVEKSSTGVEQKKKKRRFSNNILAVGSTLASSQINRKRAIGV